MRRQKLAPELAEEIAPKNILMIGPTGVGKTEIARRLARAGAVAVPQGRGLEVHRGRLRRTRRRVDDPRPGRARRRHGPRRSGSRTCAPRRGRTPRIGCSTSCCRRVRSRRTKSRRRRAMLSSRRANVSASSCAPAGSTTRIVEIDVREKSFPSFEIIAGSSVEEVDINLKDMLPGLFQGKNKKRKMKVPEALEYLAHGRRAEADRHGQRRARRGRARRAGGHHLPRRDRQDRRPRRARTAPT